MQVGRELRELTSKLVAFCMLLIIVFRPKDVIALHCYSKSMNLTSCTIVALREFLLCWHSSFVFYQVICTELGSGWYKFKQEVVFDCNKLNY